MLRTANIHGTEEKAVENIGDLSLCRNVFGMLSSFQTGRNGLEPRQDSKGSAEEVQFTRHHSRENNLICKADFSACPESFQIMKDALKIK